MGRPEQSARFQIRLARPEEAEALSELCLRSKAYWNYSAHFLQLSRSSLTVDPDAIAEGLVHAAASPDGGLLGVAGLAVEGAGEYDLTHLFVEPSAMGKGVGRALMAATVQQIRSSGGGMLSILADPHAAPFYERLGAEPAGMAPSDAIPGRELPLLRMRIGA